jgi:membrane fusion protein (multidrug efflux system)
MRLKILSIILTTALLACNNEEKQADQSANVQAATLVEVIVAQESPLINSVKSIGSLIANESVELSTQVGGTVEQINFEEGTFVKKGRLLLSVFNADLIAELNEIKARKQLAQTQLQRNKKLLKAEGVSQEIVDQAQANFDELAASEQRLQAEIAKTKVNAPFDGIIGLRQVSQGDYLSSNSAFATLVKISPIKIDFSLPEKYADLIKQGDSIRFLSPNQSTYKKALVYAVEPQIDVQSRTIAARAKFHNADGKLFPGAFVDVFYDIEKFENTITIPNQSIIPEVDGNKVFVVNQGKIESRDVVTGIRSSDRIQLLSGLNNGDTLVTTGLMQIREGMPVRTRIDRSFQNGIAQ